MAKPTNDGGTDFKLKALGIKKKTIEVEDNAGKLQYHLQPLYADLLGIKNSSLRRRAS